MVVPADFHMRPACACRISTSARALAPRKSSRTFVPVAKFSRATTIFRCRVTRQREFGSKSSVVRDESRQIYAHVGQINDTPYVN